MTIPDLQMPASRYLDFIMKLKIVVLLVVVIIISILLVMHRTKPVTSVVSAAYQAKNLIANVGGPSIVCAEATQMFKVGNVSKERFYETSELKDFPAIAKLSALGNMGGVWVFLDAQPHISIRVGAHLDGFFIEIFNTNSSAKYVPPSTSIEISDSIYVHR